MENRTFIPGSEWIYFKIYTGTTTADLILKNELYSLAGELINCRLIDKWFFIRYYDSDFHIRFRLHTKGKHDFTYIFNRFYDVFSPLVNSKLIWNIQCDTYQREMERYGSNSISLIEDLFFIDSQFLIELLRSLRGEDAENTRWKLALVLIDSFLSAFSLQLSEKKNLLSSLAENFKKEFGYTQHHVTKQLNDKFRLYRAEINDIMMWETKNSTLIKMIEARKLKCNIIANKLIDMQNTQTIQIPIDSLLASLIHMTMNRWFKSKNRLHEMVIYEFLTRYYTSKVIRE